MRSTIEHFTKSCPTSEINSKIEFSAYYIFCGFCVSFKSLMLHAIHEVTSQSNRLLFSHCENFYNVKITAFERYHFYSMAQNAINTFFYQVLNEKNHNI